MDRSTEWRPIDAPAVGPAAPANSAEPRAAKLAALVVAGGGIMLAAAAGLLWAATPQPELVLAGVEPRLSSSPSVEPTPVAGEADGQLLVDVQGAVVGPGLYELPPGSRVADAVAAAGGYAANVDLEAAAQLLNLAAPLRDGDKLVVPRLGAPPPVVGPTASASGATGAAPSGPIDLNTADEAALDTLPGVGPVTAAKIIAARTEAPFASVDDLLARGVVGPATLDKIRPLATVGP